MADNSESDVRSEDDTPATVTAPRLGDRRRRDRVVRRTLLEVNPPPAIPEINFFKDRSAGGWDYRVNIALDPGLSLCTKRNPCTQK